MRNMPDLRIELHEVIAEGDLVFFLGTIHGTNTEPLEHLGLPATNKKIAVQNMNLMRIKDGKGVERWLLRDEKAMAQQLGLYPGTRVTKKSRIISSKNGRGRGIV